MAVTQGRYCNYEGCPGRKRSASTSYWTVALPDGQKRSGLHYSCKELLKREAWHKDMADKTKAVYAALCENPRGHQDQWSVIRKFEGQEHWETYQSEIAGLQTAYDIVTAMNLLEDQKFGVTTSS